MMMSKSILRVFSTLSLFLVIEFFIFIIMKRNVSLNSSVLNESISNSNSIQEKRILLSIDALTSGSRSSFSYPSTSSQSHPANRAQINSIDSDEGVWDIWHRFKSHYFVHKGSNWNELSRNRSTCLSTQSTVDRLSDLVDLIQTWNGPLSLALFVPDIEYSIVLSLLNDHFIKCYPAFETSLSIHFAYPEDHPPKRGSQELEESIHSLIRNASCSKDGSKDLIASMLALRPKSMLNWREKYAYPQNLLRNMARRSCQTNWTMVSDIDMITLPDFDLKLNEFFSSPGVKACSKDCAYIVPTYEIKDSVTDLPPNKSALLDLIRNGSARQFHLKVFSLNQKASDLKRWEKLKSFKDESIKIGYKIDKYILNYEPTYISKPNAPLFDERFIGFGMTRNTQTYEMFAKGYKFFILDNAFLSHWGFTQVKDRPSWRYIQQYKNRQKFNKFTKEIFARYGRNPVNDTIA